VEVVEPAAAAARTDPSNAAGAAEGAARGTDMCGRIHGTSNPTCWLEKRDLMGNSSAPSPLSRAVGRPGWLFQWNVVGQC